jgi:hypothetical protein
MRLVTSTMTSSMLVSSAFSSATSRDKERV